VQSVVDRAAYVLQLLVKHSFLSRGQESADVEALYTNINVQTAIIDVVIEIAHENRSSLNTCRLHLCDLQELIELKLGKS
jgi:hypothetical protein